MSNHATDDIQKLTLIQEAIQLHERATAMLRETRARCLDEIADPLLAEEARRIGDRLEQLDRALGLGGNSGPQR